MNEDAYFCCRQCIFARWAAKIGILFNDLKNHNLFREIMRKVLFMFLLLLALPTVASAQREVWYPHVEFSEESDYATVRVYGDGQLFITITVNDDTDLTAEFNKVRYTITDTSASNAKGHVEVIDE